MLGTLPCFLPTAAGWLKSTLADGGAINQVPCKSYQVPWSASACTTKLLADEALAILSSGLTEDAFFDHGRSVVICSAIGSISSSQGFILELI
ncbi:MAG: hypothetical protein ACLQT6_19015 [Desulfomonilaceae bacterium]